MRARIGKQSLTAVLISSRISKKGRSITMTAPCVSFLAQWMNSLATVDNESSNITWSNDAQSIWIPSVHIDIALVISETRWLWYWEGIIRYSKVMISMSQVIHQISQISVLILYKVDLYKVDSVEINISHNQHIYGIYLKTNFNLFLFFPAVSMQH